MDIPAAAGPWIAVGVLLALLLLAGAALVSVLLPRLRSSAPPAASPPARRDDLADFLEHPPGTASAASVPADGWVSLSPSPSSAAPPSTARPPGAPAPRRRGSRLVPAATAVAALVLLAAATGAALFFADRASERSARERDAARDRAAPSAAAERPSADTLAEARLTFGGVVLEPHAVGITATYPELRLTGDGTGVRAHLELPTWNCLTGEAPEDPATAGCRRTLPEVADLAAPDLELAGTGEGWRISGRFATSTRPNGRSPSPTGRAYDVVVTVEPGDGTRKGWLPADGVLELGGDRAETTGPDVPAGVNVLRYRDR